ncbi:hypothetical protein [Williamsia deligens]|uniref:hypothetical protein n=1 Tax=Williamsia deligens TaxID=321325 RepID=UPI0033841F16
MWAATAVVGGVGFVVAPTLIAGDPYDAGIGDGRGLGDAARVGVADFLGRHSAAMTGAFGDLTDYWAHYHWVKVVFGLVAVGALALLGRGLSRSAGTASTRLDRARWAATGGLVASTAVAAMVVVVANVQGALAPASSALSLLPRARADDDLSGVRAAASAGVADGAEDPAIGALVRDFGRYHAVLAICLGVVVLGLAVLTVAVGRAARRAARGTALRPLAAASTVVFAVAAALLAVIVVANVGTALDPAPALQLFFAGSS